MSYTLLIIAQKKKKNKKPVNSKLFMLSLVGKSRSSLAIQIYARYNTACSR